jgi:hypothetical protein
VFKGVVNYSQKKRLWTSYTGRNDTQFVFIFTVKGLHVSKKKKKIEIELEVYLSSSILVAQYQLTRMKNSRNCFHTDQAWRLNYNFFSGKFTLALEINRGMLHRAFCIASVVYLLLSCLLLNK